MVMHRKQLQQAQNCSLWLHLRGNTCTASLRTITSRRNTLFSVIHMQMGMYPLQQRHPLQSPLSWVLQLCVCVCAWVQKKNKKKTIITSYINYVEWSLHIDYQMRGWGKCFVPESHCGQMGGWMSVERLWRTLKVRSEQNSVSALAWSEMSSAFGCFLNVDKHADSLTNHYHLLPNTTLSAASDFLLPCSAGLMPNTTEP